ncbi:MAG TPA: hypothetical protein VFK92_11315 [Burkholderiales bacterium]|nr:hypothetical protein [Burkholderiales bacterium]
MNRRSILTKTGKGLMEATGKTSNLSRDLRNILKEIDGKVSVTELLDKFDKLNETKLIEALSTMERDGYVREFIGKQDEGPRTPVGRPSSGPPSLGEGSDLDFTAFTPAKPNAKANEEARLQAQAQEIARQAQATRAREEAVARARAEAVAAARAKADADQRAKQAAVTRTGAHTPLPPLINPTVTAPATPPVVGILGAGPEAQARAQADAQARVQAEALERARREAEEKARKDAEEKARLEAEARARAEIEAAMKREAEERRLREIAERTRREEEEKARREAEARAKREAEERVRREAEERARRELEERTRREVAERLRREEEERRRREEEERARREAERQARIEAETKARVDAELRAKREAEEGRQSEKRRRVEEELRKRQEAEQAAALERALKEEQEKAEREAEDRVEERESLEREEPIFEDDGDEHQRREEEEERYKKEEEKRAREEERAAAKAAAKARKAERARERAGEEAWRGDEDALRDSDGASLSAREVWEKRRPRSFIKTLAGMLVVLLVMGIAVLPFVPLETAPYEKSAQAWLGLPVKIGSVNFTLLPLPQMRFEKVVIGRDPQMRVGLIRANPDLATLLDERATLRTLTLENVIVPKEFLAVLLQDKAARRGLGAQRVTAKGLRIDAPELGLGALEFDATLSPDGGLKSASFSDAGQLSVRLEPHGGRAAIEISAGTLPIPLGVDFGLSDFSAKGTVSLSEMVLTNAEARAFGGRIFGSARLRWSNGWSLDGDLSVRQMDAVKLAGPLLGAGTVQGKGRLSMRGLLPERMILNSQLDGSFSVQKGLISNVDMTRLLQGSGSGGGTTPFSEMSGDFSADPNRLLVRNIRLAAGLLSGVGQLEMDPQKSLSGRMQIELRAQSVQARSTLGVTGTLMNPQFRRTN